jgi:hypothetical protein
MRPGCLNRHCWCPPATAFQTSPADCVRCPFAACYASQCVPHSSAREGSSRARPALSSCPDRPQPCAGLVPGPFALLSSEGIQLSDMRAGTCGAAAASRWDAPDAPEGYPRVRTRREFVRRPGNSSLPPPDASGCTPEPGRLTDGADLPRQVVLGDRRGASPRPRTGGSVLPAVPAGVQGRLHPLSPSRPSKKGDFRDRNPPDPPPSTRDTPRLRKGSCLDRTWTPGQAAWPDPGPGVAAGTWAGGSATRSPDGPAPHMDGQAGGARV